MRRELRPLEDTARHFRAEIHGGFDVGGVALGVRVLFPEPLQRRAGMALLDPGVFKYFEQARIDAQGVGKERLRETARVALANDMRRYRGCNRDEVWILHDAYSVLVKAVIDVLGAI